MDGREGSPRVNKALMANFVGRTVRIIAKLITFKDDVAILEASDGGQFEISILPGFDSATPFVEVIGVVSDARTLKTKGFVNMGDDVDMKLADQVVQIWHDPKFASLF